MYRSYTFGLLHVLALCLTLCLANIYVHITRVACLPPPKPTPSKTSNTKCELGFVEGIVSVWGGFANDDDGRLARWAFVRYIRRRF